MSALRRLPSSFLTRATTTRTLHTTPVARHVRAADSEAGGGGGAGAKVSLSDANKAAVKQSGGGSSGSSGSSGDSIDADGRAIGRTGGGEPLGSSSDNAPAKPKITNQSVPGNLDSSKLSKEQREEVERHNKEFDAKHDRGMAAAEDRVDKKFWSGGAH